MKKAIGVVVGQVFDQLTAVEPRGLDSGGNRLWLFACRCGERCVMRVSNADYSIRKIGWASCPGCYAKAGGWDAIAKRA